MTIRPSFSIAVAIGKNDVGEIILAQTSVLPHSQPIIGEVKAALLALKLVVHYQLKFVQFEGDSKLVIDTPTLLHILFSPLCHFLSG